MPGARDSGTPCVLIATGWRAAAEDAARRAGLEPTIVLLKEDCARPLRETRGAARREGIRTVAIHSGDWTRQAMPQLYELAAARLALPQAWVIDDDGARRPLRPATLAGRVARLPLEATMGVSRAAHDGARLSRRSTPRGRSGTAGSSATPTVLAVWRGVPPDTPPGGAVTHVSGILGGLRAHGLRIALLTGAPPPPQVAAVIDELELTSPLPPRLRLTTEIQDICTNALELSAGRRLLRRVRPAFVYLRAAPFVTSGIDLARDAGRPVVLEWNSSSVWTREHWQERRPIKTMWNPVLRASERHVVQRASLVAAVSDHAAAAAIHAGADSRRVRVVPNGVDIEAVDRVLATARTARTGPHREVVGWVGSFGPWHGAEVLVEALAALPEHVHAVLIGDGVRRPAAQALAARLGVEHRIEWPGSVPHGEAVARLAGCDVLASPHVPLSGDQPFFGSPTKLFEFMAIGRPIVASALEQIAVVLEHDRTAVLVEPGDPAGLAAGIAAVLARPDRGAGLGAAARADAEARHGWDRRAALILEGLDPAWAA